MLQSTLHAIHFKHILNFDERQANSSLTGILDTSYARIKSTGVEVRGGCCRKSYV
jgi:hypothetical protein